MAWSLSVVEVQPLVEKYWALGIKKRQGREVKLQLLDAFFLHLKARCLRWSLRAGVPLRGSKLRAASRREVRATPTPKSAIS
ncbi:MAG: hypothetical protein RM347_020320 [Nostoc sp. ChiQUE02]